MDQFYAQVSVIKALMADIKELQSRLETNNERTKTAVRTAQVHELFANVRGPGGFIGIHSGGWTSAGKRFSL